MRSSLSVVLAAALCWPGCGDDDPAPHAAVVDTAPLEIDPSNDARDDLTITVEYSDADGDLGRGLAEVHDCRAAGLVVTLDLPPIANDDAVDQGVAIEGVLQLTVADVGLIAPDTAPPPVCAELGVDAQSATQATFCVVLIDAAGHIGSGDCTPPVSILTDG